MIKDVDKPDTNPMWKFPFPPAHLQPWYGTHYQLGRDLHISFQLYEEVGKEQMGSIHDHLLRTQPHVDLVDWYQPARRQP